MRCQVSGLQPSQQVARMGETPERQWAMVHAPQLPCGLYGHSVVPYRDALYIFGGQLSEAAARYMDPGKC